MVGVLGIVDADLISQTLDGFGDLLLREQDFINVRIVDTVVYHKYLLGSHNILF